MDNITHSLTGALAAKVIEARRVSSEVQSKQQRTIFWLLVLCANLPDIDGVLGFFGERIYSLQHHRGITHSFLFAPLFALLPAAFFYLVGKLKDFRVLWLTALLGILIHIFFDLITPFGTRILLPLSSSRYSLDWMFIIDPLFTLVLGSGLLLGKLFVKKKKALILATSAFLVLYLGAEAVSHRLAYRRVEQAVDERGFVSTKISTLPQPLTIFRWMGLVQTETGVLQTFFSIFDRSDSISLKIHSSKKDKFVDKATETDIARWYLTFARHPWLQSFDDSGKHIVEFRDLQFSIDERILRTVGFTERSAPFVLRFVFDSEGNLLETTLDRRTLARKP